MYSNDVLKQTSKVFLIFIISVVIGIVSVVSEQIDLFGYNLGLFLVLFSLLSTLLAIIVIYYGLIPVLGLLLFLTLSFNIEVPLISQGEYGYSANHPTGLRAAVVINQFYVIIIVWFLASLLSRKFHSSNNEFKITLEFILFALMGIFGLVSLLLGENKLASFYPLLRLFFILLLFYSFSTLSLEKIWKSLISSAVFIVIFQFLIGVIQIFTGRAVGLEILGESSEPFRATSLVSISERGMSGTLEHPGVLGLFIVLVFTFIFSSYLNLSNSNNMIILFTIFLSLSTVILTNARTSMVLLLANFLILIIGSLYIRKRNGYPVKRLYYTIATGFIALTACIIIAFDSLYNRFGDSDFIYQIYYRSYLSQMSLDIFTDNLKTIFFGIGLNNYTDVVSKLGEGFEYSNPVHNLYLLNLVEGGILFFLAYLLLLMTVIFKMITVIFKGNFKHAIMALCVLSFMAVLCVYNFTGWSGYKNQTFIFFAINCIVSSKIYWEFKNNWSEKNYY
ncbi:O-antigen ligase family protein [Sediminibacillus massiliensis]|uniref:O-antigen ligase family protein n=1 Tax=Sediminibacillus massiliensis TaxID=1926277 RepID=UPI0009888E3A|nr:O-antigen ligase family protein [Sediminibacillus massiliensis]